MFGKKDYTLDVLKDPKSGPKDINEVLDGVKKKKLPEPETREALIEYFSDRLQETREYRRPGGVQPFRILSVKQEKFILERLTHLKQVSL